MSDFYRILVPRHGTSATMSYKTPDIEPACDGWLLRTIYFANLAAVLDPCLLVIFFDSRGTGCEGRSIYESMTLARLSDDYCSISKSLQNKESVSNCFFISFHANHL